MLPVEPTRVCTDPGLNPRISICQLMAVTQRGRNALACAALLGAALSACALTRLRWHASVTRNLQDRVREMFGAHWLSLATIALSVTQISKSDCET